MPFVKVNSFGGVVLYANGGVPVVTPSPKFRPGDKVVYVGWTERDGAKVLRAGLRGVVTDSYIEPGWKIGSDGSKVKAAGMAVKVNFGGFCSGALERNLVGVYAAPSKRPTRQQRLLEQVRRLHEKSPLDMASADSLRALAQIYEQIDIEVCGSKEERHDDD